MSDNTPTISELWIYPIKSLGGIRLEEAQLSPRGLLWDRRWMLLDGEGNFMTQRQFSEMALLEVSLLPHALLLRHRQKTLTPLEIPLHISDTGRHVQAPIWDDRTLAWYVGTLYDQWFSEALGQACHLVYMPEQSERTTTGKWSQQQQQVSFADGYPMLLIGQASLDDLNGRLAEAVPMNRFRPNLVVRGAEPFAEDHWHELEVGKLRFWAEKPCARCVMITIDQETSKKGKEPLKTLSGYRQVGNKVMFGQNLLCDTEGVIRVGDRLSVKSFKPAPL